MSEHSQSDELRHDRRVERRVLWKGLGALLIVIVVAVIRERYLL